MFQSAAVGVLLALTAAEPGAKTLWLVEPLYPGQEKLVARSEESLARLMAGQSDQVIGAKALAGWLQGRQADLRCLKGDVACADPVDAFVSALGLSRVVMLKGGQEDAGYRFKVTSYQPQTGEVAAAEGLSSNLERALLAAMVKVVPLASSLDVECDAPGAVVFVDGEKVGAAPYSGQILPGERAVRLEAPGYAALEKKIEVPVRGAVKLGEKLEKIPARLVAQIGPKGARIVLDGKPLGTDEYDGAIQPGSHTLAFELDGYLPKRRAVDVKPGDTLRVKEDLEETGWTRFKSVLAKAQEDVYGRKTSFVLSYEYASLYGDSLYARTNPIKEPFDPIAPGKAEPENKTIAQRLLSAGPLQGLSAEAHADGRFFGVLMAGVGWYRTTQDWQFSVIDRSYLGGLPDTGTGSADVVVIRALQPHLRFALWRFTLTGQAGFELRGTILHFAPVENLYAIDVAVTAQAALRFHIVDGLFVEGMFRHGWELPVGGFKTAPLQGFHGGIGYAY